MEQEPIEDLIVIHPNILRKFMRHGKDYANLLALYSFYLYHAKQQKTNQPLATDEFTRKGMNWAIDRVKKTKKILKEMKLIEVVQYKKYYYIHLFFIHSKKTVEKILGKHKKSLNSSKTEASTQKKPTENKARLKPSIPTIPPLLKNWLDYCDKNRITYGRSNRIYWENQLKNRLTIDQQQAIYTAINKGWKNFYMESTKASKYQKFLGKCLMMEKDCDTLLDIGYYNKKYIYQFKNIKVTTTAPPQELFNRYGYSKTEIKTAPIVSQVKDKILGMVKRF